MNEERDQFEATNARWVSVRGPSFFMRSNQTRRSILEKVDLTCNSCGEVHTPPGTGIEGVRVVGRHVSSKCPHCGAAGTAKVRAKSV